MKKLFYIFLAVTIVISLFSSCSGKSGENDTSDGSVQITNEAVTVTDVGDRKTQYNFSSLVSDMITTDSGQISRGVLENIDIDAPLELAAIYTPDNGKSLKWAVWDGGSEKADISASGKLFETAKADTATAWLGKVSMGNYDYFCVSKEEIYKNKAVGSYILYLFENGRTEKAHTIDFTLISSADGNYNMKKSIVFYDKEKIDYKSFESIRSGFHERYYVSYGKSNTIKGGKEKSEDGYLLKELLSKCSGIN